MTTVAEPSSSSTADNNDMLLSLLQTAIPTIVQCTILDSIVQANAHGCRVSATHHGHTSQNHHYLFVKRVLASDYVNSKTSWNDFQRTLLYGRTEIRFYKEILPLLIAKGFSVNNVPTCHVANCNLDGLVDDVHVAWQNNTNDTSRAMPSREDTANKGSVLVLDSMHDYYQESPLSMNQAKQCLKAVAHLHAAAWQETKLLFHAQQRMARGSYHLSTRNPKELQEIQQSWHHFVQEFSNVNPLFFGQPNIQRLGSRMYEMAEYISEQLTPSPTDAYATLCHGDFKAMNVFLPNDDSNKSAVMIDFASTGVGMGMSDVAMHVIHAVVPSEGDDDDDYESKLVDAYLEALQQARVQYNTNAVPFPREVAMRHFRLACIDYIRFVIGRFWKTATKDSFEKKKDSMNTTLVNRDINAAMAWIAKVDKYLVEFSAEKEAAAAKDE